MRKITKNSRIQASVLDYLSQTAYLSKVREHNQNSMFGLIYAGSLTSYQYRLKGTIVNDLDYPVMIYCPEHITAYDITNTGTGTCVTTTNDYRIMYPNEQWNFDQKYWIEAPPNFSTQIYFTVFF